MSQNVAALPTEAIRIRGARVHNLQNLDLDIPRNRMVVITGPSGSGKVRWPSTPYMPRDSGNISKASRPTPDSSSTSSNGPTWT